MKPLNVLILSTSGGAGHLRAAEALHRTAQSMTLPIKTRHEDCLDFTSRTFKQIYAGTYLELVNRTPEFWGYLYQKAESKPYKKGGLIRLFDHLNYGKYLRFLASTKADAIICTHFLPYISISSVIRKKGIETPIFAATTDFDVHQYWVDPIVYRYYVYHAESGWQLRSKGIPEHRIVVAGIPVMPEFLHRTNKRNIRESLGMDQSALTVLVLSGGFGVGRIEEIVRTVSDTLATIPRRRFNLAVVCGKNQKARASLQRATYPQNVVPVIHGFVSTMHDFMSAADVVVSKSGGLTSAEALVKGLPMIIVDPIPGQEMRNADVIIEHGAGWKAINLPHLSYKLTQVLRTPAMLNRAREAARTLAKPEAAKDILTDVYHQIRLSEEKSS